MRKSTTIVVTLPDGSQETWTSGTQLHNARPDFNPKSFNSLWFNNPDKTKPIDYIGLKISRPIDNVICNK